MAENWQDKYQTLIDDCVKRESHLTDFERGFIDGLAHVIDSGKRPTPKQIELLSNIWERQRRKG